MDDRESRYRAAFEAANNGSIPRPKKVPCVWDRVDFMDHDTEADLGVPSFRHTRNLAFLPNGLHDWNNPDGPKGCP